MPCTIHPIEVVPTRTAVDVMRCEHLRPAGKVAERARGHVWDVFVLAAIGRPVEHDLLGPKIFHVRSERVCEPPVGEAEADHARQQKRSTQTPPAICPQRPPLSSLRKISKCTAWLDVAAAYPRPIRGSRLRSPRGASAQSARPASLRSNPVSAWSSVPVNGENISSAVF